MLKNILIALALIISLQFMPGTFSLSVFGPPAALAQDTLPEGDIGSQDFMFNLNAVTHDDIESSAREGWIRRGINYFFEKAIGFMATVIGSLAVLTMAFGGLRIIMSGGDETAIGKGKQLVKYSLLGLGFVLMSYILVTLVQLLIVSIYG